MSAGVPLGSCAHLQAFKVSAPAHPAAPSGVAGAPSPGAALYANVLRSLVAPTTASGRASRAQALACHHCGAVEGRLHVCLHCIHFACFPACWAKHRHKEKCVQVVFFFVPIQSQHLCHSQGPPSVCGDDSWQCALLLLRRLRIRPRAGPGGGEVPEEVLKVAGNGQRAAFGMEAIAR